MKHLGKYLLTLILGFTGVVQAVETSEQRIAVFWNTEFSSNVRTIYQDFDRRTHRQTSGLSEVGSNTRTEMGSSNHRQVDDMLNDVIENTSGSRMLSGPSRKTLRNGASWRLQSSFLTTLQSFREIAFIDRASMLRTLGRDIGSDEKVNLQALESAAVAAKADFLMQVLLEEDNTSPIGTRFNVQITKVADSQIIGMVSTLALPPTNSRVVWMTNASGFEKRIVSDPVSMEDYGRELARQVANYLPYSGS